MSFCPTKDIHSIYLDNEMPQEFRQQYEDHVKNCPECQKELAQLKVIHDLFQKDSALITPDEKFMDESFNKLQLKLNYSRTTLRSGNKLNINKVLYGISTAAAVALLAVLVPVRVSSGKRSQQDASAQVVTVTTPAVTPASNVSFGGSGKGVVLSGNIHGAIMSPKNGELLHDISSKSMTKQLINDVDVIKPDFGGETISIRITVPGINSIPVTREIELPVNVVSGYNK